MSDETTTTDEATVTDDRAAFDTEAPVGITVDELPRPLPRISLSDIEGTTAKQRNTQRAAYAAAAVKGYAVALGDGSNVEDAETVIGDVLADLRHLADALDIDFDDLAASAERRYTEEVMGEG